MSPRSGRVGLRADHGEPASDCESSTAVDRIRSPEQFSAAQATISSDTLERVRLFLSANSMPALRRLQVDENGDAIELRGRVSTFYEKQVATECARRVAGVIRVVNLIVVSARSQASDEK
jgi:osmotically-inducible protein OsmY